MREASFTRFFLLFTNSSMSPFNSIAAWFSAFCTILDVDVDMCFPAICFGWVRDTCFKDRKWHSLPPVTGEGVFVKIDVKTAVNNHFTFKKIEPVIF